MDYQKIYNSLIERAKTRALECYTETHHVIPTCMHGPNTPENKVELTPEEHYVAHQLLVKIHPENNSLVFAARMMCCGRPSNKLYGWLRRRFIGVVSKQKLSKEHKAKISAKMKIAAKGRKLSSETKEKVRLAALKRWKNADQATKSRFSQIQSVSAKKRWSTKRIDG